jgi:hypothetical protein
MCFCFMHGFCRRNRLLRYINVHSRTFSSTHNSKIQESSHISFLYSSDYFILSTFLSTFSHRSRRAVYFASFLSRRLPSPLALISRLPSQPSFISRRSFRVVHFASSFRVVLSRRSFAWSIFLSFLISFLRTHPLTGHYGIHMHVGELILFVVNISCSQ